MTALTALHLRSGRIDPGLQCMQQLHTVLSHLPQLRELSLPDNLDLEIESEAASLAATLHACTELRKLELTVNGLSTAAETLGPPLKNLRRMQVLKMTVSGWYACTILDPIEESTSRLVCWDKDPNNRPDVS